jgi:hypothetical protein
VHTLATVVTIEQVSNSQSAVLPTRVSVIKFDRALVPETELLESNWI